MGKHTKEDHLQLTPLGLLESILRPEDARKAADAMALYMLRIAEDGCFVSITVQRGALAFVQVLGGTEA